MKSGNCLNCENYLQPEFHFCPECGQKAKLHRLTIHDIFHDAVHYFTHADKGFFHLLKALLLKTGTVGREYVTGKRKKYFPALNFYLLVAAIYVLLINIEAKLAPAASSTKQTEINRIPDPVQSERVRHIYARRDEALHFMNKYSNFIAMIAIPLIAFIFWLFYKRGQYNYAEHLVSGMYMAGFANLVYVTILVPVSILMGSNHSYYAILYVLVFQITYYSIYYYWFMYKRTIPSLFKAIGVSALAVIFWTALTSFLVGIYIANGFWGLVH